MHVLEKIRKDNKLTRLEMAKDLEIAPSYYSMLIHNKRKISKTLALKIKEKFDISLDDIFFADNLHKVRRKPKPRAG